MLPLSFQRNICRAGGTVIAEFGQIHLCSILFECLFCLTVRPVSDFGLLLSARRLAVMIDRWIDPSV